MEKSDKETIWSLPDVSEWGNGKSGTECSVRSDLGCWTGDTRMVLTLRAYQVSICGEPWNYYP